MLVCKDDRLQRERVSFLFLLMFSLSISICFILSNSFVIDLKSVY